MRQLLPLLLAAATLAGSPVLAAGDGESSLAHSPWLALRFEQGGAAVPLTAQDTLRSEVTLRRAPFTIVLPVRGDDDTYSIAAWTDDSIFAAAEPEARACRTRLPICRLTSSPAPEWPIRLPDPAR